MENEKLVFDENLLEELNNFMIDSEADELDINMDNEKFSISSEDQANFFLKRIAELNSKKESIEELCERELERNRLIIESFKNKKLESINSTILYFNMLLNQFAEKELENINKNKKKKIKSIALPFGTLGFKKVSKKFKYDDDFMKQFLIDKDLPELLNEKVKVSIDSKKFKSSIKEEDDKVFIEIDDKKVELSPSSIEIIPETQEFYVKTK